VREMPLKILNFIEIFTSASAAASAASMTRVLRKSEIANQMRLSSCQ
jgi:hypothetical protein